MARGPWWGGDLQTLRNYLYLSVKATFGGPARPPHRERRLHLPMDDGSGDRLVATLLEPEQDGDGPLCLLLHGLGGCESSGYIEQASTAVLRAGLPVLRLNLRGAGLSRPTCRHFYHPGASHDVRAALRRLPVQLKRNGLVAIGFSLGGHILLKYLGEPGVDAAIRAAVSISAPLDLAGTSNRLLEPRNTLYHAYLLTHIKRGTTAEGADITEQERRLILGARTLRQLDDVYTGPRCGYRDAEHYYRENSCRAFLAHVGVPTLVVHAKDDPFVPVQPYLDLPWRGLPGLTPLLPDSGGHLGFHDRGGAWHLRAALDFFARHGAPVRRRVEPPGRPHAPGPLAGALPA